MKHIGVVGAGIMAAGMAQNFLKHGYKVYVWNRSPQALTPLKKAGAVVADSPAAAAAAADIVIECVSDDDASRSVWTGDQGILAGATKDTVLITSASLSLGWTDELAGVCKDRGFVFFDMPLTGGRGGAEAGTLSLLMGGDEPTLDAMRDDLAAIANKIFYFGPAGSGMRFKLLLNTLSAIHMNAAAQAAILAKKAGISEEVFFNALFEGNMGPSSPATGILVRDRNLPAEQVNFAIKWIEKDLRYAQAMAKQYGVEFDVLDDVHDDYVQLTKQGLGDRDWSQIIQLFK